MPLTLTFLLRILIVLAIATHVFLMYSLARTWDDMFGFRLPTTILACSFALALMAPFVWAVGLPEVPDVYIRHVRARRWWRSGRCPACGYLVASRPEGACPECGGPCGEPPVYRFSRTMVRRFILLCAVAWMLGCTSGEAWMQIDERRFAREATRFLESGMGDVYMRPRAWPAGSRRLYYMPDAGPMSQREYFERLMADQMINARGVSPSLGRSLPRIDPRTPA